MIEEYGYVERVGDDGTEVRIATPAACERCGIKDACHAAGKVVSVPEILELRRDQPVRLRMVDVSILSATLVIYGIPFAALLVGLFGSYFTLSLICRRRRADSALLRNWCVSVGTVGIRGGAARSAHGAAGSLHRGTGTPHTGVLTRPVSITSLDTLLTLYRLKDEPRTGWQIRGIVEPESVAGHSWATALLYAEDAGVDRDHAVAMALVHDLAESVTGDVATRVHDADRAVSVAEKQVRERAAMAA